MKSVYILIAPDKGTFSPAMHNAAFAALGLDFHYDVLPTPVDRLELALNHLRHADVAGANVTIPHKEAVLPYLDSLSDEAKAIGAVNTIVNRAGKLYGYNTDAQGFMRGLAACYALEQLPTSKVLILGAGGAARAILYALNEAQTGHMSIFNRTASKVEAIIQDLQLSNASLVDSTAIAQQHDVIINTTPIGSSDSSPSSSLIASADLPSHGVVCDIIYRPAETLLLQTARSKGLTTQNGLPMLLQQGALAFAMWTGQEAPLEIMQAALLETLT